MRVICINATKPPNFPISPLVEGNHYTIQRIEPTFNGDCYILHETRKWQELNKIAFDKNRFIPLSEISETEFERNYNKELQPK